MKVSVVVPSLNAEKYIQESLDSIVNQVVDVECLVVDGGSTDETRRIAKNLGVQVLDSQKGRGHQIRTGVAQARGDVILILHADCILKDEVIIRILIRLQTSPQLIGGAVGMQYLRRSLSNRFIEWLNNFRARWVGIAFGDQAQFFRREALALIGGFPDLMLMEDIELSMRLKEHGSICFIPGGVVVSSRRWEQLGICHNFLRVVWLCLSFLVQRRLGLGDAKRRDFYTQYYRQT